MFTTENRLTIMRIAHASGYYPKFINFATRLMYFTNPESEVRIMVYFTKRGYTVATCMAHPVQGATQLIRAACDTDELTLIFDNPRVHLGKGYRMRKDRPSISKGNAVKHGSRK